MLPGWTLPCSQARSNYRVTPNRPSAAGICARWAYHHPVQDVQGKLLEIGGGLLSRSEHALRTGYDAEVIDNENAQDNERARRLGLAYKVDTSASTEASGKNTNEEET